MKHAIGKCVDPPVVCTVDGSASIGIRRPLGYSIIVVWLWLLGSLAILGLASTMTIDAQGRVYLPGVSTAIPETCGLRYRFGIECPGCGLTRAFICFADGDWLAGLRLNAVGLLMFGFIGLQIPWAAVHLCLGRDSRPAVYWTTFNEVAIIALTILCLAQWPVRLLMGVWT